jgi:hypothetical protein
MARNIKGWKPTIVSAMFLLFLALSLSNPGKAADPHSACYSADSDKVFWFIQTSDTHIGARGSTDGNNLKWLVTQARQIIEPNFIIVSGDLTDSTNGNFLGIPNGPYQKEWDEYKSILSAAGVTAADYYDIPGNHDAYNDQLFAYYLNNSVQGVTTHNTQVSFVRQFTFGEYHFMGVNTADNSGDGFSLSWPYGDYAGLDTNELSFIANEMNKYPEAKLTLVFGHHPLFPTGDSTDTYVNYGLPEFLELMNQSSSSLYGYGHTHDFSEAFFIPSANPNGGFFYFNVASLGKSSSNQYTIFSIDCNGIASKTMTINTWPAVLITAPVDVNLGGNNPYAYTVPASSSNAIRALVFDQNDVSSVRYRIDGGTQWFNMTQVPQNPRLYQAVWNASTLSSGSHTIEVQASSASGTRSDVLTTTVAGSVQMPKVQASSIETGAYITSGTRKSKVTSWKTISVFTQGDKIVFRISVKGNSGTAVSGATVQLAITGPSATTLTAASDAGGMAEASWQTSAPNKRGSGGTLQGEYTVSVTDVTASGFDWDGIEISKTFLIR